MSRRFGVPAAPFGVTAGDGVRLAGSRVGIGGPALVFAHGFLGWHRKPRLVGFVEHLSRAFSVYAVDLRGHGASGGSCTYGDLEHLDVDAVVRLAREETGGPVVTMGASMGGIAVLRQAAFRGGVDCVVSISVPARWDGHTSASVRRMLRLTGTRQGRGLARLAGYRLSSEWSPLETPEEVAPKIAPTPLIVVHGEDDDFFDVEEARRIYRAAREPKRLMIGSRFGHAEDGFTPGFADRITRRILEALRMAPA